MTQEENDDNSDGYSGHPYLEYVTQEENDGNSDGYSGHPHLESVAHEENECSERQPSRFINIVGKDDISRQGEKAGQVERFRDIHFQS